MTLNLFGVSYLFFVLYTGHEMCLLEYIYPISAQSLPWWRLTFWCRISLFISSFCLTLKCSARFDVDCPLIKMLFQLLYKCKSTASCSVMKNCEVCATIVFFDTTPFIDDITMALNISFHWRTISVIVNKRYFYFIKTITMR